MQVDTSVLEERHRQQLMDLEEAMRSTWEAKAKVSIILSNSIHIG